MPQRFDPIISANFNGGEVFGIEKTLLKPNQLAKALNVRYKLGGGFTNRPGYYEPSMANFTGIGSDKLQGMFSNTEEAYFVANGNLFVEVGDFADAFLLYSGLDTSAPVEFLTFSGDLYVMNGVNFPLRIARTKTATDLVAATSPSVTVSAGQGWRFTNTGTVRVISAVGYDDITVTAKANDVLTITAATVSLSQTAGALIYQVTSLSSAPKVGFGCEFQNTWLAAGNPGESSKLYQPNTMFYSRGATGLNPEYFYDFAGTGAGFIPVGDKSGILNIVKTKRYALIIKKTAIFICSGFDSNGIPIIEPLTDVYGAAGTRAVCQAEDQIYVFTGKSIKQVGEQPNLASEFPSIASGFDSKIFEELKTLDADQSNAVLHFNPDQKLLKLWVKKDEADVTFVMDSNIPEKPWSRDTGKPAGVAIFHKGETYWGSNVEPKIYQDEVGYDDNGVGIRSEVKLADFNAGSSRISKYFQTQYIRGMLGTGCEILVRIYFDDNVIQEYTITDTQIQLTGGSPIGRVRIGSGTGVSTSSSQFAFPFEFEKLLKKRRGTHIMSVEFIVDGEGQIFEITEQEINGFYSRKFDRKVRT